MPRGAWTPDQMISISMQKKVSTIEHELLQLTCFGVLFI